MSLSATYTPLNTSAATKRAQPQSLSLPDSCFITPNSRYSTNHSTTHTLKTEDHKPRGIKIYSSCKGRWPNQTPSSSGWVVLQRAEPSRLPVLLLPVKKLLVRLAVGKACSADSHVLQKAKVFDLMPATLLVKKLWWLLIVGLNATDVIGFLRRQIKPKQIFTQKEKSLCRHNCFLAKALRCQPTPGTWARFGCLTGITRLEQKWQGWHITRSSPSRTATTSVAGSMGYSLHFDCPLLCVRTSSTSPFSTDFDNNKGSLHKNIEQCNSLPWLSDTALPASASKSSTDYSMIFQLRWIKSSTACSNMLEWWKWPNAALCWAEPSHPSVPAQHHTFHRTNTSRQHVSSSFCTALDVQAGENVERGLVALLDPAQPGWSCPSWPGWQGQLRGESHRAAHLPLPASPHPWDKPLYSPARLFWCLLLFLWD